MIHLRDTEHIVVIMHRHWAVLLLPIISTIFIAIIPPAILLLVSRVAPIPTIALSSTLGLFVLVIFWLILTATLLIELVYYWLDVWVLTNERVIDIEQRGLFHREISEFGVENVQDVTVETFTFLATLLHFGTITIHTAGDKSFVIKDIPNANSVREIIINTQRQVNRYVGTLKVGANQTQESHD